MTKLQSLQFRASEIRSKLAETDLTQEKEAELLTEYSQVETEIRKQLVIEDEPAKNEGEIIEEADTADTEYRNLVEQADIASVFDHVANSKPLDGAMAELQKECGIASNVIPLDALAVAPLEQRAVTPAPGTTGLNQQSIEGSVFPNAVASQLSIPMPRVEAGEPIYPDVATSATVGGPHTDSTSVAETTGSFNVVKVSPARFQASFFYRRVDAARFAGMGPALRQNLNEALADKLDSYIITQLTANTSIPKPNNPGSALTYPQALTEFAYGRVDGQWAGSPAEVSHVVNNTAYAALAALYQNTARGSALEEIQRVTGGITVSKHAPAVASNISTGIARIGNRRDAVAPIWEGVTLINDEVTKAATGEIVITAVMLANFQLLRKEGFYLTKHR